jgi:hypothetical protein
MLVQILSLTAAVESKATPTPPEAYILRLRRTPLTPEAIRVVLPVSYPLRLQQAVLVPFKLLGPQLALLKFIV